MAEITIDGSDLVVTLGLDERVLGLLSNLRIPLSKVRTVEVIPDGRRGVRGIRAPGLGGPVRRIGTWRAPRNRQFVCVRRHQPAIRITVDGFGYNTVLVGADDAASLATTIRTGATA